MAGKIREIFADHWDEFMDLYGYRVRKVVTQDVDRMLNCGDYSNGYAEYSCSSCGEKKKVAFRCKSRFCTSCGKIYVDERAENMSKKLIRVGHRHMVFTIPEELRVYFQKDRKRLSILPKMAYEVIREWFYKRSKRENYTPGVVAIIHTFGRDLKWNPHVHLLVTEGAQGRITEWKKATYFSYERLRKSWQKVLLDEMGEQVGRRKFKPLKDKLYQEYKEGFYVYGAGKVKNAKAATHYVGRYTGRPAIADSRIVKYDGEKVSIFYKDHTSGERIEEELDALEFIKKVIIHIPERQFKMIRYYGIYANSIKKKSKVIKMVHEKIFEISKKYKTWRKRIQLSFGHDPLECKKCGEIMVLSDIVYPRHGSVLEMIREREMGRVDDEIEAIKSQHKSIKALFQRKYEPLYV